MNVMSIFLAPLTGLNYSLLEASNYTIYLGDYNKTGEEWSDDLYLHLRSPGVAVMNALDNDPSYYESYQDSDGHVFVKRLTKEEIETIVSPLREGKYSEVNRSYVEKYFPKYQVVGFDGQKFIKELRRNYMILTKHPALREYWEERLNVVIDEDLELWDKPKKEKEIKNWKKPKTNAINSKSELAQLGDELLGSNPSGTLESSSTEE